MDSDHQHLQPDEGIEEGEADLDHERGHFGIPVVRAAYFTHGLAFVKWSMGKCYSRVGFYHKPPEWPRTVILRFTSLLFKFSTWDTGSR